MDRAPRTERTALVIDDDPFIVSALAEVLSEEGYDVHTASNGFSALRLAQAYRPTVILLDLALPERRGGEVLADLRGDPATRDAAIVIVTGNPDELTEAQAATADGIVCKPFDIGELIDTVQHALLRAVHRLAEVAPVAATTHGEAGGRVRRGVGVRRTRGRQ